MTFREWLFKPLLHHLSITEAIQMAQIDDLTAAVARNAASTAALIAAVGAIGTAPDLTAAIAGINANSDTLDAETVAITPPPAP